MSYGVFNWWWGEEENEADLLRQRWWQYQRSHTLSDLHLYDSEVKRDGDYSSEQYGDGELPVNALDGKYILFYADGENCLDLDRRFRFSRQGDSALYHEIDMEYKRNTLQQLGWGDSEIFTRLLGQEFMSDSPLYHPSDLLLCAEEGSNWWRDIMNPNSFINVDFFSNNEYVSQIEGDTLSKEEYEKYSQFMEENFYLIGDLDTISDINPFPKLELDYSRWEAIIADMTDGKSDAEMLENILFFRPEISRVVIKSLFQDFGNEMAQLMTDITSNAMQLNPQQLTSFNKFYLSLLKATRYSKDPTNEVGVRVRGDTD